MDISSRIWGRLLLACGLVAISGLAGAQQSTAAQPAKPALGTPVAPTEVYG